MHRVWIAVLACAVAACSSLALAGGASADDAGKQARASCDQERFGSTYITSLKQRNTKCGTAKKVARKYTDCRKDNGGAKGHCNQDVAHYSCNEGKRSGNKFQYSARVKCQRGSNKVVFKYTQQT
jgi:hypothetical protein